MAFLGVGAACVGQVAGPWAGAGGEAGSGTPSGTGGTGGGQNPGSGGGTSSGGGSGGAVNGTGGATQGSGGTSTGTGGSSTTGTGGASCVSAALPLDVQAMLSSCSACHGSTPLAGAPPLVTYGDWTAHSTINPAETNAQRALVRLQSASNPMPPAGSPRPSASEVTALKAWIDAGYPMATCPAGGNTGGAGGGAAGSGGAGGAGGRGGNAGAGGSDPFAGPSVCTSKTTWTGGNRGSSSMNPGKACIACHRMGEGPAFTVAGTLYPTAHEPDLCNGSNGSTTGARIVITDAKGKVVTLTPNAVGNFDYQGAVATPFQASVTYMGRERRMLTPQTNGDCNACHTATGTMSAPGRILLP